jgi:hypothetical protein
MTIMTYPQDREASTERPVRLDKTEGHVIIEGRTYPAREIVEALAQSGYVEMRAQGDSLVLGRRKITPIFKSSQERAMATLCHGSLAYCCPLTKRCAERDRALELLGLTMDDYQSLKGDAHHRFISMAKGIPFEDELYSGSGRRNINQPAVDPGYGSDDYRRDFDALDRLMQSGSGQGRNERDYRQRYREQEPMTPQAPQDTPRGYGGGNPFTDVDSDGKLRGSNLPTSTPSTCRLRSDDSIEGIGSLFSQGELSPFLDDGQLERERPSFCFSCGRTIRRGLQRCPHCGATQ